MHKHSGGKEDLVVEQAGFFSLCSEKKTSLEWTHPHMFFIADNDGTREKKKTSKTWFS